MNCRQAQKHLPAMAAGELAEDKADALLAHVGQCPDCAAELQAYEQSLSALRQSKDRSIPDGLWDGFWEKIRDEAVLPQTEQARPIIVRWRNVYRLAAAAAILVALLVGLALLRRGGGQTDVQPKQDPTIAQKKPETPTPSSFARKEVPELRDADKPEVLRVYPLADMARMRGGRERRVIHSLNDMSRGRSPKQHYTLKQVDLGDKESKKTYEF